MDQAGQLFQRLRRRGEWCRTMFSTTQSAGSAASCGHRPTQADVAQSFFLAALARQFQHRRAVVQRRDLAETPGEFRQESAVPGPTSSAVAPGAKRQCVTTRSRYCGSPCDQVLLGLELVRRAGEEVLADRRALGVHGIDPRPHVVG